MISDCRLIDADNCPREIAESGNEPWNFVGEVKTNAPGVDCLCNACNKRFRFDIRKPLTEDIAKQTFRIVHLPGHLFVTDDMIEVVVYWGRCTECRRIYWARSGPPFRRARSYAGIVG